MKILYFRLPVRTGLVTSVLKLEDGESGQQISNPENIWTRDGDDLVRTSCRIKQFEGQVLKNWFEHNKTHNPAYFYNVRIL